MHHLFKPRLVLFLLILCCSGAVVDCVCAGECNFGTLSAWYSKDAVFWENATVRHSIVQRGEPFFIRAVLRAKTDVVAISLRLWETGEQNTTASSFELLEGPDCFFRFYPLYLVPQNSTRVFEWKFRVKPECCWLGTAPLNILAQFNKDEEVAEQIFFTIANIQIQETLWESYGDITVSSADLKQRGVPLFLWLGAAVFLVCVVFVLVVVRKQFLKRRGIKR